MEYGRGVVGVRAGICAGSNLGEGRRERAIVGPLQLLLSVGENEVVDHMRYPAIVERGG